MRELLHGRELHPSLAADNADCFVSFLLVYCNCCASEKTGKSVWLLAKCKEAI